MAGGVGSRFWPKSTPEKPKQFLDLLGLGKSLLRETYERVSDKLCPKENVYILTNSRYKALIQKEIPEISEEQIMLEPQKKNTAPCLAFAGYKIRTKNPDAVLAVLPSDQTISNENAFLTNMTEGMKGVDDIGDIMTLGITPQYPATGYGYIEVDKIEKNTPSRVLSFREKPNKEKAEQYLASKKHLWNAGIFLWKVETLCNSLEKFCPKISNFFNIDGYFTEKEAEMIERAFENVEDISIDYAVMEKTKNIRVMPTDCGWSDLGSWRSVYENVTKDKEENAKNGDVFFSDTKRSYVNTLGEKKFVLHGVEDIVIVESEGYILVCNMEKEQEIKQVVKKLSENDI